MYIMTWTFIRAEKCNIQTCVQNMINFYFFATFVYLWMHIYNHKNMEINWNCKELGGNEPHIRCCSAGRDASCGAASLATGCQVEP